FKYMTKTLQQIVYRINKFKERTKMQILAPVDSGKKGAHVKVLENLRKEGFVRIRVDGEMREVSEEITLEKNKKHSIEVVIDRIVVKEGIESRLSDSIETALDLGEGKIIVDVIGQEELIFSANHA